MVEIFSLKVEKEADKVIIHMEIEKEKFNSLFQPLLASMIRYGTVPKAPEFTVKKEETCVETEEDT